MANTLYDWELVSGTLDKETTIVYQGSASAKLYGATGQIRQRINLPVELEDLALTFKYWVRTETAADGVGKIGITVNGTLTQSSAVTANSVWQELSATATPNSSGMMPIFVGLYSGAASNPVYFDGGKLEITTDTDTYIIPISEAFRQVTQVERRPPYSGSGGNNSPFDLAYGPPARIEGGFGHYNRPISVDTALRIIGVGTWPYVTALSDTIDITGDDEHLLALRAAQILMRRAKAMNFLGSQEHWAEMEKDLALREAELRRTVLKQPTGKFLARPVR